MAGLLIESVIPGSPAELACLAPGDRLLSINGCKVRDIIDYSWLIHDDEIELEISDRSGNERSVLLEIYPGEPPGIIFTPPAPKKCGNNCIFCFVHQLPKGLRKPLYVKDEDYRLSFLHGTYVTLTNLKNSELERIIQQRLSPLYISVHTTDPELRKRMLGKNDIPPILDQLQQLADGGIQLHTQVVLCPGVNDGTALDQTVNDLSSLYPAIQSLAVVPVGLTEHRGQLPELTPMDSTYAGNLLEEWLPKMRGINKKLGNAFLQLADEFFLKADIPFPPLKEYGDLPQWENGVGMVPWFMKDATAVLKKAGKNRIPLHATVVTGFSASAFVNNFLQQLSELCGATLTTAAIPNRLFGQSVTVTGLICGNDIIEELRSKSIGELILLPEVMLKEGEGCFLDDLTVNDISKALDTPVICFDGTPGGFFKTLKNFSKKKGR